jgi:hypothetical protein
MEMTEQGVVVVIIRGEGEGYRVVIHIEVGVVVLVGCV